MYKTYEDEGHVPASTKQIKALEVLHNYTNACVVFKYRSPLIYK